MMRSALKTLILLMVLLAAATAWSAQRFPPPQFETDYTMPPQHHPAARDGLWDSIDTAVLAAALVLASWLILRKRSRKWIVALMIFTIAYFGFFRLGCVCPIGAIGNVTVSIFDTEYSLPWVVPAFFLLPLAMTLFFGRGFCAGVCPLGALQDIVLLKPVKIAPWVESGLRMVAWTYLTLAVLFAATGAGLLICRYDPFISFFRLSTNSTLWLLGISMLLAALFIGRPYCRFLCPYGLLLRQCSRVSKYRVTVTPDDCIHCRLCEDACPFGVIHRPTAPWPERNLSRDRLRMVLLILLLPVWVVLGGWLGKQAIPALAESHPAFLEYEELRSDRVLSQEEEQEWQSRFADIRSQFALGGLFAGGFLALIAGGKLIDSSIRKVRRDYEPDRAGCFGCGRCFIACPKHREHVSGKQKKLNTVKELQESKAEA